MADLDKNALAACPFCGDPMSGRHGLIRHVEQGECIIGQSAFDETWVSKWNRRSALSPVVAAPVEADDLVAKARLSDAMAEVERFHPVHHPVHNSATMRPLSDGGYVRVEDYADMSSKAQEYELLLQGLSVALDGPDEWADRDTMIYSVRQSVETAHARIAELEAALREAGMQALASDGQAQEALGRVAELSEAVELLVGCVHAGYAPGNQVSDGALAAAVRALSKSEPVKG